MRITGGIARGRRLRVPRGQAVRPTAGRVRESLFAILGPRLVGARVLDLFAGSGALGIEALSRGAARATFVERNARHARQIRENLARLGLADRAAVVVAEAADALRRRLGPERFDVVLCDPPYRDAQLGALAARVAAAAVLAPGGVVCVEAHHTRADEVRCGALPRRRVVRHGETAVVLLEAEAHGEAGGVPGDL